MSTTIMPATIQTNLHLDPDQFAEAKQILSQLGMSFGEAVNIFINLIVVKHGLPFDIALPNEETKSVMLDVRAKQDLETINSPSTTSTAPLPTGWLPNNGISI